MPHVNKRIPDLGHDKELPKEKPEDYKINPLQSLFRPPHLSNDPKVRAGGKHTGHKYGPVNLSWKGPNTKFWSGVPGYLMGLPSQEQMDEVTALRGQKRLNEAKQSQIPSTFDQAFSKNAAKGNEFTYSLEEAQASTLKDVSKTNDQTLNEISTQSKQEVSEVVDKSNDGQTVIQNLENAQEGDAPGSDAERDKALGYNTSLAENEAVFDIESGTMKIPGQDELNKSANERLKQEQRTPNDPNKGQTKQPNPNAAQQNFDKIAGAIHGLATIAKALDTGEFTPPRTPSSWDSSGVGKESWRQTDPDDPDKNRWRMIG